MLGVREQYEIALAALFHDIGKFKQRAYKGDETFLSTEARMMEGQILPVTQYHGYSYRHALWTYSFFLEDLLPRVKVLDLDLSLEWEKVARESASHHNPSGNQTVSSIVARADRASAGLDRLMGEDVSIKGKYLTTPLRSIFDNISLSIPHDRNDQSSYCYPLTSLVSPGEVIKPLSEADISMDYGALWEEFISCLDLQLRQITSITLLLAKLKDILYTFTWSIPSATNDYYNDISLYDHSITTLALAVALCNSDDIEKPIRLFSADVSGIQQFIFQSKYPSFKGAAKTFRGRSFIISALSTAYRLGLCEELGLIPFVDCIDAGGKFLLLLPNTKDLDAKLRRYQARQESFFLKRYLGTLCILADWSLSINETDLGQKNFSNLMKESARRLNVQKSRKFALVLGVADTSFVMEDIDVSGRRCRACGIRTCSAEKDVCSVCDSQMALGTSLPDADLLVFSKKGPYMLIDGVAISVSQDSSLLDDYLLAYSMSDRLSNLPFWHSNLYTPAKNEFSEISKAAVSELSNGHSLGKPFLAYLKIDVDNLGEVFIHGLPEYDEQKKGCLSNTLSRYVSLSRLLNYFFTTHIRKLLETEFPNFYTVLSGGDDVFLIGPWNKVLLLVLRIREDFLKYCCGNLHLHFSTGIELGDNTTPFAFLNDKANVALDVFAKEKGGRNCVSFMGVLFSYEQIFQLNEDIGRLLKFVNYPEYSVSKAFLYRLYQYVLDRLGEDRRKKFSSPSRLVYDLARNVTGDSDNLQQRIEVIKFIQRRFEFTSYEELERFKVALICTLYESRES